MKALMCWNREAEKESGQTLDLVKNPSEMITDNSGWWKTPFALKNGWKRELNDLIQPNGIVDQRGHPWKQSSRARELIAQTK